MLQRRLEILAERQDLAADGDQVIEHAVDFLFSLAKAKHHAGLADQALVFGDLEQLQAAVIFSLRAYAVVKPRDGFDVVIENLRPFVEHPL